MDITKKGFLDSKNFRKNLLLKAYERLGVVIEDKNNGSGTRVNKNVGLISFLDSSYKSDVPSTNYAMHLKAIAFESAIALVIAEKTRDDIYFETTRGEFFSQNIASFLFPFNRFPTADKTERFSRNFYKSIIEAYFGGSTKDNIQKSLVNFLEGVKVSLLENYLLSKNDGSIDPIINKFTFDVNINVSDSRIKNLNTIQNDVEFLVSIIKPAHTSFSTKLLFSEFLDSFRNICTLLLDGDNNPVVTHDGFEIKIKGNNTAICDTGHIDVYDYYYEDIRKPSDVPKTYEVFEEVVYQEDLTRQNTNIFQASPRIPVSSFGGNWVSTENNKFHTKYGPFANSEGNLATTVEDIVVKVNDLIVEVEKIYPLSAAFSLKENPPLNATIKVTYKIIKNYVGGLIINDPDSVLNNFRNYATEHNYSNVLLPTGFTPFGELEEFPIWEEKYKYRGLDLFNSSLLNSPLSLNFNEVELRSKLNDYAKFESFNFNSSSIVTLNSQNEVILNVNFIDPEAIVVRNILKDKIFILNKDYVIIPEGVINSPRKIKRTNNSSIPSGSQVVIEYYSTVLNEQTPLVPKSLEIKDVWRRLKNQNIVMNSFEFLMNTPEDRMFGELHQESFHPFYSDLDISSIDNRGNKGYLKSLSEDPISGLSIDFSRFFEEKTPSLGKEWDESFFVSPPISIFNYVSGAATSGADSVSGFMSLTNGDTRKNIPIYLMDEIESLIQYKDINIESLQVFKDNITFIENIDYTIIPQANSFPKIKRTEKSAIPASGFVSINFNSESKFLILGGAAEWEISQSPTKEYQNFSDVADNYPLESIVTYKFGGDYSQSHFFINDVHLEYYNKIRALDAPPYVVEETKNLTFQNVFELTFGDKINEPVFKVRDVSNSFTLTFRTNQSILTSNPSSLDIIDGSLARITKVKNISKNKEYSLDGMILLGDKVFKLDENNPINKDIGFEVTNDIVADYKSTSKMNDNYELVNKLIGLIEIKYITKFPVSRVLSVYNQNKNENYNIDNYKMFGNNIISLDKTNLLNENIGFNTNDSILIDYEKIETNLETVNLIPLSGNFLKFKINSQKELVKIIKISNISKGQSYDLTNYKLITKDIILLDGDLNQNISVGYSDGDLVEITMISKTGISLIYGEEVEVVNSPNEFRFFSSKSLLELIFLFNVNKQKYYDLTSNNLIFASSGEQTADNIFIKGTNTLSNSNVSTRWQSLASNDSKPETLDITFNYKKKIDRISLFEHNWKNYEIFYDDNGTLKNLKQKFLNENLTLTLDNEVYLKNTNVDTTSVVVMDAEGNIYKENLDYIINNYNSNISIKRTLDSNILSGSNMLVSYEVIVSYIRGNNLSNTSHKFDPIETDRLFVRINSTISPNDEKYLTRLIYSLDEVIELDNTSIENHRIGVDYGDIIYSSSRTVREESNVEPWTSYPRIYNGSIFEIYPV